MIRLYPTVLTPVLLAGFTTSVFTLPAVGQESAAPEPILSQSDAPSGDAGQVIAFTPADFAAARPNTALDMINRLPGFSLLSGDQVRGFAGAAGNVLIDSQRPTIKTDTLSDTVARIPIDQVERIELIRGGAPGIDMQGQTVVANVIRKRVDTFQQVFEVSAFGYADTGKTLPGWNYQATRRAGDHQVEFSASRGVSYNDSVGTGSRTIRDLSTGVTRIQSSETEGDGPIHSARASYKSPFAGGEFTANGLLSTDEFKNEQRFFDPAASERFISRSANDRGEIGLNYTRPIGEKFEIEALALSKLAIGASDSSGVTGSSTSLFKVEAEAGETIGRSVLRYDLTPDISFEGGGEVAFNYREQQVALRVDGAAVSLPASDVRVEEVRGEVFLQSSWRPTPKYTFEAGVRVERSTINQSGDTQLERSFTYPKPRLVATWAPTANDQVRVRVEHEIGQLNFRDFISNVNLSTNVLSAGNADLEPDKTWVYEIAFEKRFWDNAAAVLTLRRKDISDVVDVFPFLVLSDANGDGLPDDLNGDGQPDGQLVSGPGNLGDGTNNLAELNLTLPLKRLGLNGAEVKIKALFQNSEVTDPLTGEARRISGQRPNEINVNFRQDLPDQKLTFGAGWFAGWSEDYYRLKEVQSLRLRNFFSSFVEYKPTPAFTLRAEINNFDPYQFILERRVFNGPRGSSDLALIETERRNSQVLGMIRARWAFG